VVLVTGWASEGNRARVLARSSAAAREIPYFRSPTWEFRGLYVSVMVRVVLRHRWSL
jgi:hypothetical protein